MDKREEIRKKVKESAMEAVEDILNKPGNDLVKQYLLEKIDQIVEIMVDDELASETVSKEDKEKIIADMMEGFLDIISDLQENIFMMSNFLTNTLGKVTPPDDDDKYEATNNGEELTELFPNNARCVMEAIDKVGFRGTIKVLAVDMQSVIDLVKLPVSKSISHIRGTNPKENSDDEKIENVKTMYNLE